MARVAEFLGRDAIMMQSRHVALGVCSALLLTACGGGEGADLPSAGPPRSSPPQPEPSPGLVRFVDATAASGIAFETAWHEVIEPSLIGFLLGKMTTSGAAAGDYDNDGDIDLFITRGDTVPNLLYRNNGSGAFTDVAAAAGLAFTAGPGQNYRLGGPTFADMDGDGDLDLFLGGLFGDPSFLFANDGDGTFSNVTTGSGIDTMQAENSLGAAFGDYDLDGDLDMLLAHYGSRASLQFEAPFIGDTEHLWRNDSSNGTIVFTSVSQAAGISPSVITLPDPLKNMEDIDWTFTPTFARIDADRYPDILLVADFNRTQVFINNTDGTFSNATDTAVLTDTNGMGSAVGDLDNDGDLDWFVTSIMFPEKPDSGNRLYLNENGRFADGTEASGVRNGGWGWGACFLDFQNDGALDIYATNGWDAEGDFASDVTTAFVGSGGGQFVESAAALGLDDTEQGRGVVCADFDNDGDTDIFQLYHGSPGSATMWRNDTGRYNSLVVKLIGLPPNTEAAGARIHVTTGVKTQMREIMIGNNFVSQNPAIQVFGLGAATVADNVTVEWPDGRRTDQGPVASSQTLILRHPGL
jgi:hypothetical protein